MVGLAPETYTANSPRASSVPPPRRKRTAIDMPAMPDTAWTRQRHAASELDTDVLQISRRIRAGAGAHAAVDRCPALAARRRRRPASQRVGVGMSARGLGSVRRRRAAPP